MMKHSQPSMITGTGLAMFSMFFGAGNIVFPLALGIEAQENNVYALLGILITAVCVPFAGLLAMSLYDGDYKSFFSRLGPVAGFILAAIIMALIGPLGALPRCIALSYSTAAGFLPDISLPIFSLISCVIIFLLTYKPNAILDILGYILTPVLLGSLAIIVILGIIIASHGLLPAKLSGWELFLKGLSDGYQTMDLLGAFFFSSVIVMGLKNDLPPEVATPRTMIKIAFKASLVGASLLALTYIAFGYLAGIYKEVLGGVQPDFLISVLSKHILGPYASVIASISVALACLTTAVALAAVFAEFIHNDITLGKIGYIPSLVLTLILAFLISTLEFTSIVAYLTPILQICYPALIVLTLLNILYKLYGFKPVKLPVLVVFLATLILLF